MPRQRVKVGDTFWVPIEDNSFVLGQIIEEQREVLNSITCVFFDCRVTELDEAPLNFDNPICCQFVTRDLFNSGQWQRIANLPNQVEDKLLPYRETMSNGWIGASMIGSGSIRKFLAAFYGLREWDEMFDPNYYQSLLLPSVERKNCV
ncbi:Imm26 family immunity protein [Colwellia psychrerythraea]|uniref:Uncharacterized protein n=1 Tax=Colwellia psychrerythraea TaxID=28229 RepID=A0A099KB78_COLPS|nr:Imm26 family immunity protein [Colwellia psychrerythraea]KGJ87989.1 hypothetical protein ND2E_4263 [Colwellia psychrerythraea]